jgi:hypothetical protein
MECVSQKEGTSWRNDIAKELEKMGIIVFDPYRKPFVNHVDENYASRKRRIALRNNGSYSRLCKQMRAIRSYDLSLVDRADFIIAHIKPDVPSWGTADEFLTANRMKKPIFLSIEGGRKACPLWLFGVIPSKYIYDSPEDILRMLRRINEGRKFPDSSRWRLLRKEYR